jgi:hypothetical protein
MVRKWDVQQLITSRKVEININQGENPLPIGSNLSAPGIIMHFPSVDAIFPQTFLIPGEIRLLGENE